MTGRDDAEALSPPAVARNAEQGQIAENRRSTAPPASRHVRHRLMEWGFAPIVAIGVTAGTLVRLTVKDATLATAWLFYVAQPPCLAVACLCLCVVWLRLRRRIAAGVALAAAAGFSAAWVSTSFRRGVPATSSVDSYRAVVWNTSYGTFGRDGILDTLRRSDADLIGVVERPKAALKGEELSSPGRPPVRLIAEAAGLQLFSRHPGRRLASNKLGRGGLYLLAEVELGGRLMRVLLVDVTSSPRISRADSLGRAAELAARHSDAPLLVLGDFNTPPDSVHFGPLRAQLVSAFETAGTGYAPTWPSPLPVLALDQAWLSTGLAPVRCEAGWTLHSDHRPLLLEFRFAD